MEFQTVAKVGDIPEGEGRCFPVSGTMVGLFLHNGEYFAINDFCPHMGASLSESPVAEDGSVMCSWHAWCFSIKDGTWLDNSKSGIKTPTYDVRVEGNEIQVAVPPPDTPKSTDSESADPTNADPEKAGEPDETPPERDSP
ncbi:Rieske (2Fe-2S) protein [Fuerstiella marisgermanici]|uniref:Digoxigenin ferredoxin subunit n=1 Tax=Fuerstiella marisgermanici TaxID=1891926 RepID=A0A1P8WPV0_9PLAN|nr:Rieske (2Fe-2S) protein [Fuerstiella marisgermanici]APZ96082.1 Digoxigenin ferredoxin subunit [Fuerstiella marisgermanici]